MAVSAWFFARFLWRYRGLVGIRRSMVAVPLTGEIAVCWARCSARFGVRGALLATSPGVYSPMTMGIRRKAVVLPAGMPAGLGSSELQAVLLHEFAHMCRNDFAKNLVYELLSVPLSYHPLLPLVKKAIMESREMVCDAMAAEVGGRRQYAGSLLRLASALVNGAPARTYHAIGIFDANTFERRVMRLTGEQTELRGARRAVVLAACAVLGMGACGSALAFGMYVDGAPSSTESSATEGTAPQPLTVPAGVMAGHSVKKVDPKYPEAAKKAKVQGAVVLDALIGADGTVKDLRVASGPEELRGSALDAVRQWEYRPFLLNGNPVEVKTTITIIYTLAK